jgi:hydrogenase expression/formation protein HypC
MRVCRVEGEIAWIDDAGHERPVALLILDSVAAGDYLLVHADFAIAQLELHVAEKILATFEEVVALQTPEKVIL